MSNLINDRNSINDNPSALLGEMIRYSIHNIHTCQPATVVKFYKDTQTADIVLGVARDIKGQLLPVPTLLGVPVSYPSGADFSMTWPLIAGDTGLALFAESSIDNWLTLEDAVVNPNDTRMHDYSDGFFIPGIKKYAEPLDIDGKSVTIKNDLANISLDPSGIIKLGNEEVEISLTKDGSVSIKSEKISIDLDKSGKAEIKLGDTSLLDTLVKALTQISTSAGGAGAQEIAKIEKIVLKDIV